MIEKFDAFISYKHAPLDNRVADQIQKGLERFHIPAKIRQEKGRQKIERIFRDKAELPITSSLDNNISYALENSDFLIVICSHSTKLSGWVPREIEYFLKFHPISHVLTVLAEGEPDEVIPEQLLKTTVTRLDEDGEPAVDDEGHVLTEEVPLEPLSCDWRLPLRKARKEELPRLAAAIIGCSYDELIQRARQYRMRRLGIALGAAGVMASVAIGYLIWSRAQIQKNYEIAQENLRQAQINQSVYLANASDKVLKQEHDGVGAVQLALASLLGPEGVSAAPADTEPTEPGASAAADSLDAAADFGASAVADSLDAVADSGTRPVTPESVYALTNAVRAYIPEVSYRYPNKKYSMSSPVARMALDEDRTTLFLLDESGELGVFDIVSQEKLYTRAFEDAFTQRMTVLPCGDSEVFVCDGYKLYLIDWKGGKELWQKDLWVDDKGQEFVVYGADYYNRSQYQSMGFVWKDPYPEVAMALSPDGDTLAIDGSNDVLRLLDVRTGEEVDRAVGGFVDPAMSDYHESLIQKIVWSPNGENVAAVVMPGQMFTYTVSVMAYELGSGTVHRFDTEEVSWEDLAFAGDNRLLLLTTGNVAGNEVSYRWQAESGYDSILHSCIAPAFCFSLENDTTLWQTDLPWQQPWENAGSCAYAPVEDFGVAAGIFTISNMAYALHLADGAMLSSQEFDSSILSIERVVDGQAMGILKDGKLAFLGSPGSETMNYQMTALVDTGTPLVLTDVLRAPDEPHGNVYFLCQQEKCRDVIGFGVSWDEAGQILDKTFETYPDSVRLSGTNLLVCSGDTFTCFDLADGDVTCEVPLDGMKNIIPVLPGELGSGSEAYVLTGMTEDEYAAKIIDLDSGSAETVMLDMPVSAGRGGWLYGLEADDGFGTVVRYSLADRTYERIPVEGPADDYLVANRGFFVSPDGTKATLATHNNSLVLIDLTTGECRFLKEESTDANYFVWSEDGRYYASISNTLIRVFAVDGTPVTEIPTKGRRFCFAYFEGDDLYVAYGSAKLFRYRIEDGSEEGVADISLYLNDMESGEFVFTDSYLYVTAGSKAGRLSTIDLSEMKRVNLVDSCCGYSPEADRYVVLTGKQGDYHFVTYPHYSTEELIRKGYEFVGDNQMTTEMRTQYGLDSRSNPAEGGISNFK